MGTPHILGEKSNFIFQTSIFGFLNVDQMRSAYPKETLNVINRKAKRNTVSHIFIGKNIPPGRSQQQCRNIYILSD